MRTIYLMLKVDWDDYEDVHPQIILEDAIRETAEGVSISILEIQDLEGLLNSDKKVEK